MRKTFLSLFLALSLLAEFPHTAAAQDGAWGEVVNPDGSIRYDNLTDNGVVSDSNADWMPSIPLPGGNSINIPAEYHVYSTPSGNQVVMPTATTLLFMSLNPQESGMSNAASEFTNGVGGAIQMLGGALSPSTVSQLGYSDGSQFFSDMIAGNTNLWTIGGGMLNMMQDLTRASLTDRSLYTTMLLYTPNGCGASPAGCGPQQLGTLPGLTPFGPLPPLGPEDPGFIPPDPLAPPECPSPEVIPGAISHSGALAGPNYPLVVGQDPSKTGVNVTFTASVAPTIYHTWEAVPIEECTPRAWPRTGQDCYIVDWYCEQHTQTFPECVSSASGSLRLTQDSKNWIVNELSIHYPGAYVHRDSFSFPATGGCAWEYNAPHVQVEDPGEWEIYINGQTSGTPVSPARSFGGKSGDFNVWLKETAIIK